MSSGFPTLTPALIDDGVVLFWAAWISIVVIANTVDALRVAGVLSPDARLASGNYSAIVDISDRLAVPHRLDFIIFLVIILWEAIAGILLWRAALYAVTGSHLRLGAADTGLGFLLALFAGFMLADEVFHAFKTETDHRSIATLLLISLLALHILPA
jgi:hypothetical protein